MIRSRSSAAWDSLMEGGDEDHIDETPLVDKEVEGKELTEQNEQDERTLISCENVEVKNQGSFCPTKNDTPQKHACRDQEVVPPATKNKERSNLTNQGAGSRMPGHLTWQRWGVTFVESNGTVTSTSAGRW
ncbi:hypothetical protein MJO29_006939 [Puccinia striiformis f. sp. tritici]|nr:hypothetical protein MJO29_006939 [Puccinia striiformis f. sp. tritici]